MHITATFTVLDKDTKNGVSWRDKLGSCSLLEHGVRQAQNISFIDHLVILTDIKELLQEGVVAGQPVLELWPWAVGDRMDYITCDWTHRYQQSLALEKANLAGDLHFFLDWRLPLLSVLSWDRMYHRLLEDRVAARIVPVHLEDPHLYTPLGDISSGRLFGVWTHPGRDRQKVPQLYRLLSACVAHLPRLNEAEPLTKGVRVPLSECVQICSPEDLELANFLYDRLQD